MPKFPTLKELLKDRKMVDVLTVPQMEDLNKQLQITLKAMGVHGEVQIDPATFAEKWSEGRWQKAKHLEYFADRIMEMEHGDYDKLLVFAPPRHGKSEFLSFWVPIWFLARHPDKHVMFLSYEERQAARYGRRVRNAISQFGDEFGLQLDYGSKAVNDWNLVTGGGMYSIGAGGAITGKGADLLIVDDIIKNREEAASETVRENLWDWWQTVVITRLEPKAKTIVLGTRWHEDDILARLLDQHKQKVINWRVLSFPAIAERDDVIKREEGEALWPARFPIKALEEIKAQEIPYHWLALYQCRPSPEEGGAIKRDWWNWYDYRMAPTDFDQVIQSWDTTFKDLTTSDYVVGQVWGRIGAQFYLLHQVRKQMDPKATVEALQEVSRLYPEATGKIIEDAASGSSVISMLQHEVSGMIPWPPKGRKKQNKEQRLSAQIPKIEAGNIYLPKGLPWAQEFVEEFAVFPNGKYDDQVDAATQALDYLAGRAISHVNRMHGLARTGDGGPITSTKELATRKFHGWVQKRRKKDEKKLNKMGRF